MTGRMYAFDEFLAQWLRFDRLKSAVRDRRLYPEFSLELVGGDDGRSAQAIRSSGMG